MTFSTPSTFQMSRAPLRRMIARTGGRVGSIRWLGVESLAQKAESKCVKPEEQSGKKGESRGDKGDSFYHYLGK
jgi:hypothetical protein